MSQRESRFTKGSDNEKRFRMGVCALGAMLVLYLAAVFSELLFSLEGTKDFFIESAFMVSETSDAPSAFIDEMN